MAVVRILFSLRETTRVLERCLVARSVWVTGPALAAYPGERIMLLTSGQTGPIRSGPVRKKNPVQSGPKIDSEVKNKVKNSIKKKNVIWS